jgi:hypothetical protein
LLGTRFREQGGREQGRMETRIGGVVVFEEEQQSTWDVPDEFAARRGFRLVLDPNC